MYDLTHSQIRTGDHLITLPADCLGDQEGGRCCCFLSPLFLDKLSDCVLFALAFSVLLARWYHFFARLLLQVCLLFPIPTLAYVGRP